jgi:hypothetical protein
VPSREKPRQCPRSLLSSPFSAVHVG